MIFFGFQIEDEKRSKYFADEERSREDRDRATVGRDRGTYGENYGATEKDGVYACDVDAKSPKIGEEFS